MPPSLTVSKTKTVTFGGFQKCSGPVPESVKRKKGNFSKGKHSTFVHFIQE